MPKPRKEKGGHLSLLEVLKEPNFRFCFQKFCEQQHSEEVVLFWVDLEEFRHLTDAGALSSMANEMIEVC
jgi:hypothetical protein